MVPLYEEKEHGQREWLCYKKKASGKDTLCR